MKKKFTNIDLNEPKNWVISKIIFDKCKKEPKFEIIEFTDGSKWTYHDLCSFTLKAANQLHEIGVKKGENIVVIIDNPKKFIPIGEYLSKNKRLESGDDEKNKVITAPSAIISPCAKFTIRVTP